MFNEPAHLHAPGGLLYGKYFTLDEYIACDYKWIEDAVRNTDDAFKADLKKARANGLPANMIAFYSEAYARAEREGINGIATMMLPGCSWQEYFEDILGPLRAGETPPQLQENSAMISAEDEPTAPDDVDTNTATKCRKAVTELCEFLGWELLTTGGAVQIFDNNSRYVTGCKYQRGTKNGAWWVVADELYPLLGLGLD